MVRKEKYAVRMSLSGLVEYGIDFVNHYSCKKSNRVPLRMFAIANLFQIGFDRLHAYTGPREFGRSLIRQIDEWNKLFRCPHIAVVESSVTLGKGFVYPIRLSKWRAQFVTRLSQRSDDVSNSDLEVRGGYKCQGELLVPFDPRLFGSDPQCADQGPDSPDGADPSRPVGFAEAACLAYEDQVGRCTGHHQSSDDVRMI